MAATLQQMRGQHEQAREKTLERLAELDAQRPALALDGDPGDLAELDEGRLRLQLESERHELALEEIARREEAEAAAQSAQERKALESQLMLALASRRKAAERVLQAAEGLGDVFGALLDAERAVVAVAGQLGAQDRVHGVAKTVAGAACGRLFPMWPFGIPRVPERDSARLDEILKAQLDVRAV
jgi:hypothetical protein